jgi:hypothetical protein
MMACMQKHLLVLNQSCFKVQSMFYPWFYDFSVSINLQYYFIININLYHSCFILLC